MRYIWHKNLSVAVFTPQQRAILQASQSDPWKVGEGTAPVLSMATLEKMHLPPAARYTLHRAGICIYGYNAHLTWFLKEAGGPDLAWWGWPEAGIALLAAGWSYQRASADPRLRSVMHHLFGLPSEDEVGEPLMPLTLPL